MLAFPVDLRAVLLEDKLDLAGQEEANVFGLVRKKSLETLTEVCFQFGLAVIQFLFHFDHLDGRLEF